MPRKPNLFVIGAMKSGTTTLYRYLGAHPDVYMSPVKEPMHFSRPENFGAGHESYLRLFEGAGDEAHVGEASTEYSKRPAREGVAGRLHDFQPRARLIYVLRDPFDRIVSQFKHLVAERSESRTLCEALRARSDYLTNSYYAYQLRPYLERFGRDAVYVDTFERLTGSPREFCGSLYRWLGVDPGFVPPDTERRFNPSPAAVEALDERSWRARAVAALRSREVDTSRIPALIRRKLKSLVPKRTVADFESDRFREDVEEARRIVRPILAGWIDELETLTGRSFDAWPSARDAEDAGSGDATGPLTSEVREVVRSLLAGGE